MEISKFRKQITDDYKNAATEFNKEIARLNSKYELQPQITMTKNQVSIKINNDDMSKFIGSLIPVSELLSRGFMRIQDHFADIIMAVNYANNTYYNEVTDDSGNGIFSIVKTTCVIYSCKYSELLKMHVCVGSVDAPNLRKSLRTRISS
jgi:hypothetical protein